jgi:large subunit ribosomal protein L19
MAKKKEENTKAAKLPPVNKEERRNLDLRPGDTVKVFQVIQEKGKTRSQAFEGIVLARKHGTEDGATFTVRKVSEGVGVERIFPLYSPAIEKIDIIRRAKVRRAKLYYIRTKAAKEVNRQMKAGKTLAAVAVSADVSDDADTDLADTPPNESLDAQIAEQSAK